MQADVLPRHQGRTPMPLASIFAISIASAKLLGKKTARWTPAAAGAMPFKIFSSNLVSAVDRSGAWAWGSAGPRSLSWWLMLSCLYAAGFVGGDFSPGNVAG